MHYKYKIACGLGSAFLFFQLPCAPLAQQLPDFSGNWVMDANRSESFASHGHAMHIIKQTDEELTIEHKGKGGAADLVRHYRLDSSENVHEGGIKSRVKLDKDRLVITSYYPVKTIMGEWWVTSTVAHSLAAGGNELVTETAVTIDHGYTFTEQIMPTRTRDVFVRQ